MTKKILVTGASGFIGAHTVIDLLSNGYEVRGTIRDLNRATDLKKLFSANTKYLENLELVEA
nr:GDP-mannose 4,6-dehydratase [Gammaproteobacteria bacterium]